MSTAASDIGAPERSKTAHVAALAALVLTAAGCSVAPDTRPVEEVARSFAVAVAAGNGAGACRLLTQQAADAVSGATPLSCPEAISSAEVPEQGASDVRLSGVEVWGDAAQVVVGGDVLFLRRTANGWRVSAAGCRPRPSGPYDCQIGG